MTVEENIPFIEGKRKYLFCVDQVGVKKLKPIIENVIEKNITFEMVFIGYKNVTDMSKWFRSQKMGSYLYVSTAWHQLTVLKTLAEDSGFTEEEARYIGHGVRMIKIFCSRCHGITEKEESQQLQLVVCKHCFLELSISDHFSSLRNAYLGYVAKP